MKYKKFYGIIGGSILLPVIGGFIGCGIPMNEIDGLNIEWILMISLPIALLTSIVAGTFCSLSRHEKMKDEVFYLVSIFLLISSFLFSINLLENACGI